MASRSNGGPSNDLLLSSIIKTFEAPFLAQYQEVMLPGRYRALAAMLHCRTALSPRMQVQCEACDELLFVPHSCGHRACPHCRQHESEQWLERQLQRQVPGDYFLLTFTLPAELRALAWRHQRTLHDRMMQCAWATVRTFSQNDQQLQGTPGAIAVLHTHTRRLDYHPHVHLVMPAAAIDAKQRLWRTKTAHRKSAYLFNHKALAKVFRGKMLAAIAQAGLPLPPRQLGKWVVHCQAVGAKALVYLGRYVYRGVLQEKDILACQDGQVTFRYQPSKTRRRQTRTLPGADFLWLLLRHVLPKGFRRARNFGFLHPNSKRLIHLLQVLLKIQPGNAAARARIRPVLTCPCCGGTMKIIRTRIMPLQPRGYQPTHGAAGAMLM